jgi:dienelactone hydrolase
VARAGLSRLALLAALVLAACATTAPEAGQPPLDSRLHEDVHRIPVAAAGDSIVLTSFRPRGKGPFPWLVLSHGTATTPVANRAMGRYRPLAAINEWVRRGYAVLAPVRRGYGASGGSVFGDSYGTCARPDFRRAGEGGALDLLATVEWARTQADLDPKRWMLVGQSAGGFASIYTASKRPAGLAAVLAFAPGRGGRPDTHPGEPCAPREVAALFASIAPRIEVPVLWFYAENDQFIGPAAQHLWFDAFHAAGGRGALVVIPPFPAARGHGVFPSAAGVPLWTPAVAAFFRTQDIPLPF